MGGASKIRWRGRLGAWLFSASALVVLMLPASPAMADSLSAAMPDNPRYVFHSIGDEVGLSTRGVTAMIQDSNGFVWVGTQDGLFRCDGAEVRRFDKEDGLPDSWILQLVEGPDGSMWFLAGGKIGRFNGFDFSIFNPPPGVEFNIPSLYFPQRFDLGPNEEIFVATDKGLWELRTDGGGEKKLWTAEDGLPGASCYAVKIDENGAVWVATDKGIASLYPRTGEVKSWPVDKETIIEEGAAMVVDGQGTVWFRTLNHLHLHRKGDASFSPFVPEVPQSNVQGTISKDKKGRLLLPTSLGLFIHKDDGWDIVSAKNGLRASSVTCALEDSEGGLWIGLAGVGVQRWTGRGTWSAWTSEEGLPDDGVWGSVRDKEGRLWIGTSNGIGVWIPNERRWAVIQRKDGLVGDRVWKLAAGPDGWIWALSRRTGFNRINPHTLVPEPLDSPIQLEGIPMEMANAPDGSFWVASSETVARIYEERGELVWKKLEMPKEISSGHEVIKFTEEGTLWIGGSYGVGRFDGKSWRHFSNEQGLQPSTIMNLAAISADEAWLGYYEGVGITRLRIVGPEVRVDQFRRAQGLVSDRVWMIERDRDANIWVGGADGLSVISPDGSIRIYDRGDGLLWNDINQAAFLAQPDGSVLIGTGAGLAYYTPTTEQRSAQPPRLALTSVELGGVQALKKTNPEIDYDQNTFVIKFAGLTFRNPAKVRYRYRLLGWEDQLNETRLREVRYAALPAGRYTFEVFCRSVDGHWNVDPVQYSFRILPPWWERWWTRLGAFFLLILLISALLQFRTRRLAADRRRLEKAVDERNAQLAKINEELKEMSFTDSLTKTRNRRFFSSIIEDDISATLRKHYSRERAHQDPNRDLLFFIIDLDHFKRVNDIYGHSAGDTVLVETSRRLNESLRKSDLLVRWGGEEFLILCRDANRADSMNVARRILNVVGSKPFEMAGGQRIRRTCSVGWAALPAYLEEPGILPHETVLELADKALYVAKQSGRNQAVGVEMIEEARKTHATSGWLDEPIEELEGKMLRLIRVPGPVVPADSIESRPPTRSSVPPAASKKHK